VAQSIADKKDRKEITEKFVNFMETHIAAETRAIVTSTEAISKLCGHCEQHRETLDEHFKESTTEHARVITAVEAGRDAILTALPSRRKRKGARNE